MLRKIALLLLIGLIFFLTYVYCTKINLLNVGGNSKNNYYPYIRYILSILLSILILFVLKRKLNLYHLLNLLWLFPLLIIVINIFFSSYNIEKLDFILGKKIEMYKIKQYKNRGWMINKIIIEYPNKVDTLYVSENPFWENKSYQLKDKRQSKLVKSWITGYYYVSVK